VSELSVAIGHEIDEIIAESLKERTKNESQIAQFVLFRNIFDICYLRREDLWMKADSHFIEKVGKLGHIREYLITSPLNPDESIREYVLNDSSLRKMADLLSGVIFATNPFDALDEVSLVLADMNSVAVGNQNNRLSEDVDVVLSFDDAFSLFCAAFLASDLINIAGFNGLVL
jgi:hypothetical protein